MSLDKTTSGERLSFTIFLAVAVHAVVILGVFFPEGEKLKPAATLNITLATHQAQKAPEQADFLAQANQEASGTVEEARELTSRELADIAAPNINEIAPLPQQKTTVASRSDKEYITTTKSDFQLFRQDQQDENETRQERIAQEQDSPLLNPEIASLQAKLDKLQEEFARRPRIRRMTSVATKSSVDAAYLSRWTERVEMMGNQHFPQTALEEQIFGSLRLSVIVNSNGSVEKVEILKPSGHPILDQAAMQIVRLAGPFDSFPPEIRQNADQLDIIRTWHFEISGLKTGSSNE